MTPGRSRPLGVLITRSREGNDELATRLRSVGLNPIPFDTISFSQPGDWAQVDQTLRRLKEFDWVAFTSSTGARYFGSRMRSLSLPLPWGGPPHVAAVGDRTALVLEGLGLKAEFVPEAYTTETLGRQFPAPGGARVLLLRADIASRELPEILSSRGFIVEEVPIYRTMSGSGSGRRVEGADIILFASPSAVKGLCSLAAEGELDDLKKLKAVCIGPVTQSAARERGFLNTVRPESFTLDAVVQVIERLGRSDG